jgi:hypothetical protein
MAAWVRTLVGFLPSLRDIGDVAVLCTFSNIHVPQNQQLGLSELTAKQLLARAGGTVRHGRRYGLPITNHRPSTPLRQ